MKLRNRWLRRLALAATALGLVLALAAAYLWFEMRRRDSAHASFLACGKSINLFLKDYAHALAEAHAQGDPAVVLEYYAHDYHSAGRGRWCLADEEHLGAAIRTRLAAEGREDGDRTTLAREIAAYLGAISRVDHARCKIDLIERAVPGNSAVLTVKYVLDGVDRGERRFEDRFFVRWRLRLDTLPNGLRQWRITSDELVEGERVAGQADGFLRPEPGSIGVEYVHRRDPKLDVRDPNVRLKFGVIEHASGGVAAADYDDDGRPDLFFADGVRCRLFRNVTTRPDHPAFRDVTDLAGLDGIDQAHCGLFCDVDGDGQRDLFVVRYLAPSKFYRNRGDGTFEDHSRAVGLDFVTPGVSACFLDYDGDGRPDLYVGNNGNAFNASPNIPFYATNGEANRLYRNVEGRRFVDVTESSGTGDTGWTLAVAASDYDGDGRVDLAVANDFGRKVLYRNNGDGTFADVTRAARMLDFSGGMGLAFGDLNFDGRPDLYTSNINSNQRWFGEEITLWQYGRNVLRSKYIVEDFGAYYELYHLLGDEWRELGKTIGEGNSLFYNNGDGTFRELKDSGTSRAGWSWGVALLDMDNDTDLDIYVANGWISGKSKDDL